MKISFLRTLLNHQLCGWIRESSILSRKDNLNEYLPSAHVFLALRGKISIQKRLFISTVCIFPHVHFALLLIIR